MLFFNLPSGLSKNKIFEMFSNFKKIKRLNMIIDIDNNSNSIFLFNRNLIINKRINYFVIIVIKIFK